jgi:hypothetical protein
MKNKNIAIAISSVLALIAAVGTTSPVFAHTDKYYKGYSQGQAKASEDYNNAYNGRVYYKPFCPTDDAWTQANGPHSSNFCAGFIDGYNAQWTSLAPVFMQRHWERVNQQTEQSSNVNIKGNNNRVVVNQQASNNVGSNGYGYGHSSSSGINPRCTILCANIQVR